MKSPTETHELKKCALRQSKDGTIVSFVLHPHEDNSELINAPVGSVFEATFKLADGDGSHD